MIPYNHHDTAAGNILAQVRALDEVEPKNDGNALVDMTVLEPLTSCVQRCAKLSPTYSLREITHHLTLYLNYLNASQFDAPTKLQLAISDDRERLNCTPLKPHHGIARRPFRPTRIYTNDGQGVRLINDKRIIDFQAFSEIQKQFARNDTTVRMLTDNATLASSFIGTGRSIAGHGALEKDYEYFKLPDNITLRTYYAQGQSMPDHVGIKIEAGKYQDVSRRTFKREFRPSFVPNYIIYPPDSRIHTLPGSIITPKPAYLSTIISVLSERARQTGESLVLDLAACQSYITPNFQKYPKQSVIARLEITGLPSTC
jgi:hypothetical protein